jgi:hypothetical protein
MTADSPEAELDDRIEVFILDWQDLDCTWIGFRRFSAVPSFAGFQRDQRMGLIDMNHCVELIRHIREKVVAHPFCLRPIDHANGALQARFNQGLPQR